MQQGKAGKRSLLPRRVSLNHVHQLCHRTNGMRIKRHDAIVKYIARTNRAKGLLVHEEPHIRTPSGLHKPDLVVIRNEDAYVIDAQVINGNYDLEKAHTYKSNKYRTIKEELQSLTERSRIHFGSATLTWRGLWSGKAAKQLVEWKIINSTDIKVIFSRVLVGGLASYRTFQSTTAVSPFPKTGIG